MTSTHTTPHTDTHRPTVCDPATGVTRSLLGYGVVAGPLYVGVSLAQALTRDGFDLRRHSWSLLANGDHGWVQVSNLVLAGLMVLAAAVGVRRALGASPGGIWGPRLLGAYGACLVAAGAFRADPADGFPLGTPAGPGTVSWHGLLHLLSGAVGFLSLVAACLVLAGTFAARGSTAWTFYSRATGIALLAGFGAVASGTGGAPVNLAFTLTVVAAWLWIAALTAHLYQQASSPGTPSLS